MTVIRAPFGDADCEAELTKLQSTYSELYFDETPFNSSAIKPETYLIIGRRGAGKTALAESFSFPKRFRNPIYIKIKKREIYQQVWADLAHHTSEIRQVAIPRLERLWEYILWRIILQHTHAESSIIAQVIKRATPADGREAHDAGLVNSIINRVCIFLAEANNKPVDERIDQLVKDEELQRAKTEVLKIARIRPIIIAFDTEEKYDVGNDALMNALAALVQFAAEFNLKFSDAGIHLKVFMSGEVFPYLEESVLENPLKSVKGPVYLFWRPKDLLRLICWRFYHYLKQHNFLDDKGPEIHWTNPREVFDRMWKPYFGQFITNARGFKENSFSYLLRHTQMRPRQLILLCNAIAECAVAQGKFPAFSEEDIRIGIRKQEIKLANEIINSFSLYIGDGLPKIVDALLEMPMLFTGKELERRARESANKWNWQRREFSKEDFIQLVAELGIVGLVRRHNESSGYIDADFEYSLQQRLTITGRAKCVVHPMFYSRFRVEFNSQALVMPFSTERPGDDHLS
ncbi:MAG TPA: hypothetical protein VKH81_17630 [Candidatus Angelobacter sp.]|nr:hypothetical protein [Candidatus Angelobacter sp.]